ncbi:MULTISPECIES: ATP-binding cassette domain-containing protein [Nocardiaceae]|uniref:ABC transporter ATP-binding protein n=1 Tax=Rhodococcoides kroppenstedtii TaxID=293050 RepID=A0ABS7NPB7_9NOCA|nr:MULTISPECIES: ATP-binding cassette domain-containing protein [Rhodococcus]AMY19815.1 Oligopeptide transport ATP-binding protein OppD [Rhodococcus sp. PBTS 1]MBY6312071.1 ABC transporter ATP-binding protein [Rhodococcus kroppenstedtii]MBY6319845.1 ABC transporter ATP-binding protein [Rhodococcus kroppenstedtii]MBY6398528.1 ABC transporter ATP-binding protein [Rhodococcus kroppenstedtii]
MLDVADLTVSAGRTTLVAGVTFSLSAGERVALVGRSGSGKSLTASAVAGCLAPDLTVRGSVRVNGTDVAGVPIARRPAQARAALIVQDSAAALEPVTTVRRHLGLALRARHSDAETRTAAAESVLRAVDLEPAVIGPRRPAELSGGQRQRVCIALALVSDAPLLVADEPTTALDVVSARTVVDAVRTAADRGRGLVFVTHDLAIAAALCSRVVVLDAGRVVEDAPVRDVLTRPAHAVTADLVERARALSLPSSTALAS